MSSNRGSEVEGPRPNSGTESGTAPLAHSFQQSGQRFEPSEPKARAGSSTFDTSIPFPQSGVDGLNSTDISSGQTIIMQNYGSHNQLHVGDVNSANIIGHNNILLDQQTYNSAQAGGAFFTSFRTCSNVELAPDESISVSTKFRSLLIAVTYIEAMQRVLDALFVSVRPRSSMSTGFEKNGSEEKLVEEYIGHLIKSISSVIEGDHPGVIQALRDQLMNLRSELHRAHKQLSSADNSVDIETLSLEIMSTLKLFLFENQMARHIPSAIVIDNVKKRIKEAQRNAEASSPRRSMKYLPRAKGAYDDYVSSHHRRVSCFKGTREALLKDMGEWVAKAETNILALSGLAGIGKSTIAQTIAESADNVGLLGASFFFSRDEEELRTAAKFFTTIAFQLCVHDLEFASAIETVLMTERGRDDITKHPEEQLETLILEPLRNLAPRRVLIVVDALDECIQEEGHTVLKGLHKLALCLPSFKVVLTTRPQQHFQLLLASERAQQVFHLHNIEDKVVDGDIRLYLKHHLSRETIQDHFQDPAEEWYASDDEIESLVKAAGRLFIIASTSVLFVLDKDAHDPEHRMKQLLDAIAHDRTPFEALNNFYTVILRSALPKGCESRAVARYQSVVGAIMVIQTPLPVDQLAKLIGYLPMDVRRVLGKLQAVILIDDANDVPRIYHKSFPDYVQHPARCKDEDLRIDIKPRHTVMAANCLAMMNQRLRQNIFGLCGPARFMDNRECSITKDQFEAKFPFELCYACTYWANHVESSIMEDQALVDNLETFVNEHLLHWFEALSWIEKLDSAHHSLLMLQKRLNSTSDLGKLVADGFRFIAKFYKIINQSALHTYHSALPFTPTETSLYKRYSKQMTLCCVEGGPKKWDALITIVNCGFGNAGHVVFSTNSKMFACYGDGTHGSSVNIYDAISGIHLGRIGEGVMGKGKGTILGRLTRVGVTAIANDFSKAAVADGGSITLYNVSGFTPVATIKLPTTVLDLELSPDGSRLVAGLEDGTIDLWDTVECKLVQNLGEWEEKSGITYSSDGNRIAFASCDGTVKLLDGRSGRNIANLASRKPTQLMFSGDGSHFACLESTLGLWLWRSEDGTLIENVEGVEVKLAISNDGSLLVTGKGRWLKLWRNEGLELELVENPHHDLHLSTHCLAFSQNGLLGIISETALISRLTRAPSSFFSGASHFTISGSQFSTLSSSLCRLSPTLLAPSLTLSRSLAWPPAPTSPTSRGSSRTQASPQALLSPRILALPPALPSPLALTSPLAPALSRTEASLPMLPSLFALRSSPAQAPSPSRASSPAWALSPSRALSHAWTPSPSRASSPAQVPSPSQAPSPAQAPSPSRASSPAQAPSPSRASSPAQASSPARVSSPSWASGLSSYTDLYDTNSRTFIARLPVDTAVALAFSPDCTRLATGSAYGGVYLWDMLSITASYASAQPNALTRLAFSPDCLRLVSVHVDETLNLWDTSNPTEPILSRQEGLVTALAFSIDGWVFALGFENGTVQLWRDKNRMSALSGSQNCSGPITEVALSSSMLATAVEALITLWDLGSRAVIATLNIPIPNLRVRHRSHIRLLTLSHDNRLLAVATGDGLTLWELGYFTTQNANFYSRSVIGMAFSRDCSRLAIQCYEGLRLFNIHDNKVYEDRNFNLFGLTPCWHGLPVWLQEGTVVTRFPQQTKPVTVLYPHGLDVLVSAVGPSMIALGCKDGRILIVRAN